MNSLWYVKGDSFTEVTKTASDRFDHERFHYPTYPAIAPLSFPYLPGSSIAIDGHFEASSTTKRTRYGTGKESTEGGRCAYLSAQ